MLLSARASAAVAASAAGAASSGEPQPPRGVAAARGAPPTGSGPSGKKAHARLLDVAGAAWRGRAAGGGPGVACRSWAGLGAAACGRHVPPASGARAHG